MISAIRVFVDRDGGGTVLNQCLFAIFEALTCYSLWHTARVDSSTMEAFKCQSNTTNMSFFLFFLKKN